MLPNNPVRFSQLCHRLTELDFNIMFRFSRRMKGSLKEHDHIAVICRHGPQRGVHLARICTCCIGNVQINDYDHFKNSITKETYDSVVELLMDYAYTDIEYKKYDSKTLSPIMYCRYTNKKDIPAIFCAYFISLSK